MPFTYHLPLPRFVEEQEPPRVVRFQKWLVRNGAHVNIGTPVAIVDADGVVYEISANGDGFLRERLVGKGDVIPASAPLALVAADGESIPYGKPYSLARRCTKGAIFSRCTRFFKELASLRW